MGPSRSYSQKTIKLLFGLSGGRCSFPECRVELAISNNGEAEPTLIANIAHIRGLANEGPRADINLTTQERNSYSNLMILCPTHHTLIDNLPDQYPTGVLEAYKVRHERWVNQRLSEAMPNVGFPELDIVCKHVAAAQPTGSTEIRAVPPEEKMRHNRLGEQSRLRITLGMAQSHRVADYLQRMASTVDPDFPGNLRMGFMIEYTALRSSGLDGDSLFIALCEFAGCEQIVDFNRQAAGLAVLTHLFQVCDIFEAAR